MSPSKLLLIQLPILLYICNPNFIYGSSGNQNLFSQFDHELAGNKELVVVKGLDLTKYVGYWYQIAAIPTFFEPKKAINVRATYTMNSDGTVHVLNEEIVFGFKVSIQGTLYKADPSNDEAKFKVKFNVVPVPGNYWVLYVDDDYQYALVGDPTRLSLFILSKKMQIEESVYEDIVQRASDQGYDVSKLSRTNQIDSPVEDIEYDTSKIAAGI